jgi:uncharacterized protein (DUF488 family)
MNSVIIWTIGHSTRALGDFLTLLKEHTIQALADVRRFPGSRRHPHFGAEALAQSLARDQILYVHFPELGGRRTAVKNSPNTAWRNAAFRGYADHMATAEFAAGIDRLIALAAGHRTALMCAEALWWQCHRALIADYLKATGFTVLHIRGPRQAEEHPYTAPAKLINGRLSYAPPDPQLAL